METLRRFFHWLVTTRYTRFLEEEVARLRAENRALVNSLLVQGGVSPISLEETATSTGSTRHSRRMSRHQLQVFLEGKTAAEAGRKAE